MKTLILILSLIASPALADIISAQDMGAVTLKEMGKHQVSITRVGLASESDEKAVLSAFAQFYTALNLFFKGDIDLMKEVWSHRDSATYMGPGGGLRIGWGQILGEWEAGAAMKLGGKVEAADIIRITMSPDIAVIQNYENGENTNTTGGVQKVSIRATNTFCKEDGKWKMIGHHTDLLSFPTGTR